MTLTRISWDSDKRKYYIYGTDTYLEEVRSVGGPRRLTIMCSRENIREKIDQYIQEEAEDWPPEGANAYSVDMRYFEISQVEMLLDKEPEFGLPAAYHLI